MSQGCKKCKKVSSGIKILVIFGTSPGFLSYVVDSKYIYKDFSLVWWNKMQLKVCQMSLKFIISSSLNSPETETEKKSRGPLLWSPVQS